MKRILLGVAAACAIAPAFAQTSVGVSIGINQPGVYGRINIGDVPPPALVLPQPVLIAPPPVSVPRRPIYLYVPDAHQRDWRRYCGRYAACGQPVYFVQENWYQQHYVPAYRQDRDRDDDRDHGKHGKGHGKKHKHDD